MMKHIFPIALVIVAVILGTVYLVKRPESESFEQMEATEMMETGATTSTDNSPRSPEEVPAASVPTKSPVTTTPAPTEPPVTSGYTMAQVAVHADASSCWTVIEGKVYDLTAWISKHPGGKSAIIRLCGVDGTAAFNGQHGGQARPERELAPFFIGNLSS